MSDTGPFSSFVIQYCLRKKENGGRQTKNNNNIMIRKQNTRNGETMHQTKQIKRMFKFSTLWPNSAYGKLTVFCLIFPRKQGLTLHANYLQKKTVCMHCQTYFRGKNKKIKSHLLKIFQACLVLGFPPEGKNPQDREIRSEKYDKMAQIDYPIRRAKGYRIVNFGHFNKHF